MSLACLCLRFGSRRSYRYLCLPYVWICSFWQKPDEYLVNPCRCIFIFLVPQDFTFPLSLCWLLRNSSFSHHHPDDAFRRDSFTSIVCFGYPYRYYHGIRASTTINSCSLFPFGIFLVQCWFCLWNHCHGGGFPASVS